MSFDSGPMTDGDYITNVDLMVRQPTRSPEAIPGFIVHVQAVSSGPRGQPGLEIQTNRWNNNCLATHGSILAADIASFWTAFAAAVVIRHVFGGQFLLVDYLRFVPLLPGFAVVYLAVGLYPGVGIHPVRELRGIFYANSVVYLMMMAGTFLSKTGILFSRLAFTGAWALSILLVILFRNLVRSGLARKKWWGIPVVLFGAGREGRRVVDLLAAQPSLGLKVAVVLDDDPGSLALAPLMADQYGLSYAIVAMPGAAPERLREILRRYAHRFRHFLLIPNVADLGILWVSTRDLGGVPGLEMSQNLLHAGPRMAKRAADLVFSLIAAVLLTPVLLALAVLVRMSSHGPAFYSQPRIGRDRRVFHAWKFRTMTPDAELVLERYFERNPAARAEWRMNRKLRDDPRVTPLGRFLRQFSLDELPQLWNVFRGQMSLAGPRPIAADELVRYGDGIELYTKVLPGITGLWQVSGRNDTTYDERVRLDEYYVRNWSIWMDLWILGRTMRCLITRRGAY
ncbi:MAG TPA: undecaprenyl-phosphate galactose phosphotransferase WbaP [Bryobacteraceae bacterium]|nr:undecaprenyl-phosphate galactose phosphotransferase WbaP [Bryobacteraceae bacterium]